MCVDPARAKILLLAPNDSAIVELATVQDFSFTFEYHSSATNALERCVVFQPDVVLLHLDVIRSEPIDVCAEVLKRCECSIMILGDAVDEDSRVSCLETGAVDYILEPFSSRELALRIMSQVSRLRPDWRTLRVGPLAIDRRRREIRVDGSPLFLTESEFRLVEALALCEGDAHCRIKLMRYLDESNDNVRAVDVHVCRLRSKLRDSTKRIAITSVRKMGYRLEVRH